MSLPIEVLIVDDEPPARERLERLVGELDGWSVAASCASGREALEQVVRLKPGIVLLDIRMPGMTGIETARHLSCLETPPAVVFTTAYDQYALEAFESRAVGYLLKPVRRERLESALAHAARVSPALLDRLAPPRALATRRHIAVRVRDELRLIPVRDIVFFRAEQKYVTVRHGGGEDLIDESLRRLEEEFAAEFVRVHRSLLVAVGHVEALEKAQGGGHAIRLRGGCSVPVSRRQLGELKRRLTFNGAPAGK
jgi:two-component system, LytTR family, response regulator AlgR